MKQPSVFISHSSRAFDDTWVSAFVSALKRRGAVSTLFDTRAYTENNEEIGRLENHLRECDLIVVLADEQSIGDPKFFFEYGVALCARKEIVVVAPPQTSIEHLPMHLSIARVNSGILPSSAVRSLIDQTPKIWGTQKKHPLPPQLDFKTIELGGSVRTKEPHTFTLPVNANSLQKRFHHKLVLRRFLSGLNVQVRSVSVTRVNLSSRSKFYIRFTVMATEAEAAEITRRLQHDQKTTTRGVVNSHGRRLLRKRPKERKGPEKEIASKAEHKDN